MNDTDLLYSEMGKRLADQRNNYAHGNLDIDFIDKSLIDLIYTERIVYAIVLLLKPCKTAQKSPTFPKESRGCCQVRILRKLALASSSG